MCVVLVLASGSRLLCPSTALNSTFDPRECTTLLRFWLGMPVYEQQCAWCGACQDPHGYHSLVCKKTGLKVKRHNGLREVANQIHRTCVEPGIAAQDYESKVKR